MLYLLIVSFFALANESENPKNLFLGYLKYSSLIEEIHMKSQEHGFCSECKLTKKAGKTLRGLVLEFNARVPLSSVAQKEWLDLSSSLYHAVFLNPADRTHQFDAAFSHYKLLCPIITSTASNEWQLLEKKQKKMFLTYLESISTLTSNFNQIATNSLITHSAKTNFGEFCRTHVTIEFFYHLIKDHQLAESLTESIEKIAV